MARSSVMDATAILKGLNDDIQNILRSFPTSVGEDVALLDTISAEPQLLLCEVETLRLVNRRHLKAVLNNRIEQKKLIEATRHIVELSISFSQMRTT